MESGNDQLATLRYDLKRLTSSTSKPNIALIAVKMLFRLSFIQ